MSIFWEILNSLYILRCIGTVDIQVAETAVGCVVTRQHEDVLLAEYTDLNVIHSLSRLSKLVSLPLKPFLFFLHQTTP